MKIVYLFIFIFCLTGCMASNWKIHGGPEECKKMCKNWDLEFAGMVGIGSQSRSGEGATACVCQVPRSEASINEVSGLTGSLSGPITAQEAAIAAQMAMENRRIESNTYSTIKNY